MIALALAFGAQRGKRNLALVTHAADVSALTGKAATFTLYPTAGRLEIASKDAKSRLDVEMSLVVDGVERPLAMRRVDVHTKDKSTLTAEFPIELGGEERATGSLELRMDPSSDFLTASLAVTQDAGTADHTYALRFGLAPEGRNIFIPGVDKRSMVAFAMKNPQVGGLGCYPGHNYIHVDVRERPRGRNTPITFSGC